MENLLSAIEAENYRREVTPSQWPTSGGYISSSFGGRANPFGGYGRDWHPGIDIATDYGEPVYASAAGYVQQAGWYGGYGIYARINHDYGYQTAYGHMSRVVCSAGQYVKKARLSVMSAAPATALVRICILRLFIMASRLILPA